MNHTTYFKSQAPFSKARCYSSRAYQELILGNTRSSQYSRKKASDRLLLHAPPHKQHPIHKPKKTGAWETAGQAGPPALPCLRLCDSDNTFNLSEPVFSTVKQWVITTSKNNCKDSQRQCRWTCVAHGTQPLPLGQDVFHKVMRSTADIGRPWESAFTIRLSPVMEEIFLGQREIQKTLN